ncbi:hypothetical protein HXX01_01410, partial [Candidatus Nomurabacteria bacterium]|nr:hypothetical protein [Candidatus Nomurabacteria bacterium]
QESNRDALSSNTFLNQQADEIASIEAISPVKDENKEPYSTKNQNLTPEIMSTNHENFERRYDLSPEALELEKYKLQLAHELELEKIQATKEEKEREQLIREQELQLKRDELDFSRKQKEDEKRKLLFSVKTLSDNCNDEEYSLEEANSILERARKALSDCDKYCFVNDIAFQESIIQVILQKIISILSEFIGEFDEDDDDDELKSLKFDRSFRKMQNTISFHSF